MAPEIERNSWSIVLIGSFNPAIFHPTWFLLNGVIAEETAKAAEVRIVHPDIASMTLGALRIEAHRNRFHVETNQAPEISLHDHVLKVFGELLPHSQVTHFGLNRDVYFRAQSSDQRTKLGRKFGPVQPWGAFGRRIEESSGPTIGGMTNVSMREVLGHTDWTGHIEARLMPAAEIDAETGVHVSINHHFEIKDYKDGEGAKRALRILRAEFEDRMDSCEEVILAVMEHLQ